jgi:ATP-dependent Clp protease ATP-binding subunit ClpC
MQLVKEIKRLNCILFIDDIHQIVAGGSGKTSSTEASHFLKPALTNDEIQMIGATNFEEFRNNVEKDTSFLRCFQTIKLDEPDDQTLMQILHGYRGHLEEYHKVAIQEDSIHTILMWVRVLLRDRALPDKALDLLDRSAARISIQGGSVVTSESVLETISEISSVPLNRMSVSETAHFRNMQSIIARRVVGQQDAVRVVSNVLCTSKLRMTLNPSRPKGIFLFVGPTGVGKTELAKSIAEFLFGDDEKVVRIDMSEYMERYSASRLVGTSPGYVGYYDQNQLVDKIRTNPYSLILLDEIEKADAQLLNIFLQVFDAGRLTDGKGKVAYFDNATIVMTSNIGTHLFAQNKLGYGADSQESRVSRSDLMKEVKRFFQPEFLNRIDEIVFFTPLTLENVREIAEMKLFSIFEQLRKQGKQLVIEEKTMLELCKMGYDYEYGARNLERVLRRKLLDKLAQMALKEDWGQIKSLIAVWEQDEVSIKTTESSRLQEILNAAVEEQDYLEE